MAASGLAELSLDTDGAGIQLSGDRDVGDTVSEAMEVGDATGVKVAKSLMP